MKVAALTLFVTCTLSTICMTGVLAAPPTLDHTSEAVMTPAAGPETAMSCANPSSDTTVSATDIPCGATTCVMPHDISMHHPDEDRSLQALQLPSMPPALTHEFTAVAEHSVSISSEIGAVSLSHLLLESVILRV